MGRFLAQRRFNFIDGVGFVCVAMALRDGHVLLAITLALLFPVASVLAERGEGR